MKRNIYRSTLEITTADSAIWVEIARIWTTRTTAMALSPNRDPRYRKPYLCQVSVGDPATLTTTMERSLDILIHLWAACPLIRPLNRWANLKESTRDLRNPSAQKKIQPRDTMTAAAIPWCLKIQISEQDTTAQWTPSTIPTSDPNWSW